MDEKFRSRKWFLTLFTFTVSTALLVGGYVSESIWRDCFIALSASYFAANVFDKRVQNGKE